eukprot:9474437-Pyramimonas_sp.AAC.1
MVATVHKTTVAASWQRVHLRNQAVLQSAGGPGSGAYLQYPTEAACALEDVEWATATRCRLLLPRPECSRDEMARAAATRCNQTAAGACCRAPLGADGYHAATCQPGGGAARRHGGLAKAVGALAA